MILKQIYLQTVTPNISCDKKKVKENYVPEFCHVYSVILLCVEMWGARDSTAVKQLYNCSSKVQAASASATIVARFDSVHRN